jgi:integrase
MATPKKLKSGHWRAQVYLGRKDGKPVYGSVTAETKDDCSLEAAKLKKQGLPPEKGPDLTVGQVVEQYIESCVLLSPTTVSGYRHTAANFFKDLMEVRVDDLTDILLQDHINAESKRKTYRGTIVSPKSVRNAWGLISASLRHICHKSYDIKLPQSDPKFLELPEPDFVIHAIQGTDVELPCMLALWLSLSMSEIRGLKYSSIRNGCIYIDQVLVDVEGEATEKARGKVSSRNRMLNLPETLFDLISKNTDYLKYKRGEIFDDYLIHLTAHQIRNKFKKLMPSMTFHQLRHMNASVMLQLNVPEKYAMERGGWSTPHTMKRVYQHTFSAERKRVDDAIDAYFSAKYHTNAYTKSAKH